MKRRKGKREIIRNRIIVLLALIMAMVIMTGVTVFTAKVIRCVKADEPAHYIYYTVQDGDRLWTIARGIYGDSCDIRKRIDEISELNGIRGGRIYEGQVLQIGVS